VVDEAVDHGGGDHVVAEPSPQRPNSLLEVTISEAPSQPADDEEEGGRGRILMGPHEPSMGGYGGAACR